MDTAPLTSSIRAKEAAIKKLFRRIEGCEDEALLQAYEKRIADRQKEVNELRNQLRAAEARDVPPLAPLDLVAVSNLLADLRGLLNEEIPVAAEAIRELTGPITIRQEPIPGRKRGARWIATFSPDLLRVLRYVAGRDANSPRLAVGNFSEAQAVEVPIEKIPDYERLAPYNNPHAHRHPVLKSRPADCRFLVRPSIRPFPDGRVGWEPGPAGATARGRHLDPRFSLALDVGVIQIPVLGSTPVSESGQLPQGGID